MWQATNIFPQKFQLPKCFRSNFWCLLQLTMTNLSSRKINCKNNLNIFSYLVVKKLFGAEIWVTEMQQTLKIDVKKFPSPKCYWVKNFALVKTQRHRTQLQKDCQSDQVKNVSFNNQKIFWGLRCMSLRCGKCQKFDLKSFHRQRVFKFNFYACHI